jgi:hypothetical protein
MSRKAPANEISEIKRKLFDLNVETIGIAIRVVENTTWRYWAYAVDSSNYHSFNAYAETELKAWRALLAKVEEVKQ